MDGWDRDSTLTFISSILSVDGITQVVHGIHIAPALCWSWLRWLVHLIMLLATFVLFLAIQRKNNSSWGHWHEEAYREPSQVHLTVWGFVYQFLHCSHTNWTIPTNLVPFSFHLLLLDPSKFSRVSIISLYLRAIWGSVCGPRIWGSLLGTYSFMSISIYLLCFFSSTSNWVGKTYSA